MPTATLKQCRHAGCPGYSDGSGYCPVHNRQNVKAYDDARGNAHQRGYDRAWASKRKEKLRIDPLCEQCRTQGFYVPAAMVHHKDSNPRNNEWINLESLCNPCHEKTKRG